MNLKKLVQKAHTVLENAYAPYSNFRVGSCITDENGNEFVGCNVENASYGATICAESSALTSLVANGSKSVVDIVVAVNSEKYCPPCGLCLQRLSEFSTPGTKVHMVCINKSEVITKPLHSFMPVQFSAENF